MSVPAIRLWKIDSGALREIPKSKLNLEERLEDWLASDISTVSPNLLLIGRQVPTNFSGPIDLLAMEENGDIVIIELKRDKTHREITAQVLDYASYVKDLTAEDIQSIANKYFKDISFEEAYKRKFKRDLPDSINEQHKLLIVGSEIDDSSQRIINYLSEKGTININALTFNYFKEGENEYIARTFLIEPTVQNIKQNTRLPHLTEDQLQSIATEKNVNEMYSQLDKALTDLFDYKGTTRSSLAFVGTQEGKANTIFSLIPQESSAQDGLKFQVYLNRFSRYFNTDAETAKSILPDDKKEWKYYKNAPPEYSGYEGFFKNTKQAHDFLLNLSKLKTQH